MASKTRDKVYLIWIFRIDPSMVFSIFNMDQLGKIRRHQRLEHLKISRIAKFESDTSYYNERRYTSAKLRKFTKLFGGGASLCPTPYKRL